MKRLLCALLCFHCLSATVSAKNESGITVLWPEDKPAIKVTFEKFRQTASYGGQNMYSTDVTVQNLTDKQIPRASLNVHFTDKNKVRVGEGLLQVSDLEAGQVAKVQMQFNSVGTPAGLTLSAKRDMLAPGGKTIPLKIVSVPAGARLKVDGQEMGITPIMVRFTIGEHQLQMAKEGYAPGNTPLAVTEDELPGGSITLELGGLSRDVVELRDGTNILGDVISLSMTQIVVRADGKDQTIDRNQVKKIMLIERTVTQQPTVVQPSPQTAQ